MKIENLANLLLHYGNRTTDIEFKEELGGQIYYNRVSTYTYNGKIFYLHLVNGEVIECFELKN